MDEKDPLTEELVLGIAAKLGLDVAKFQQDMNSADVKASIDRTEQLATDLQIEATPTFVIGGELVKGLIQPDFAIYLADHSRTGILTSEEWINTFVVSDADGNFQLTANRPIQELTMRVNARGVAMTHFTVSPEETRKKLVLGEGA